MATYIYAYNPRSRSANNLADQLNIRQLSRATRIWPGGRSTIINWGGYKSELRYYANIINPPNTVKQVSNKLIFFNTILERGGRDLIPRFWTSNNDIPLGFSLVARYNLTGHSGQGAYIINENGHLIPPEMNGLAPLYVEYIKKKWEFRVHIFRGEIIQFQRKARRRILPDDMVDWKIRNHQNGFVYVQNVDDIPNIVIDNVRAAALTAFGLIEGLDFGAVDVIYNTVEQKAYVLEINTAPGLEGSTLERYIEKFQEIINNRE